VQQPVCSAGAYVAGNRREVPVHLRALHGGVPDDVDHAKAREPGELVAGLVKKVVDERPGPSVVAPIKERLRLTGEDGADPEGAGAGGTSGPTALRLTQRVATFPLRTVRLRGSSSFHSTTSLLGFAERTPCGRPRPTAFFFLVSLRYASR